MGLLTRVNRNLVLSDEQRGEGVLAIGGRGGAGDELIHLAEQAMIVSTRAGTTTWAVDFLPFRKMSAPLLT